MDCLFICGLHVFGAVSLCLQSELVHVIRDCPALFLYRQSEHVAVLKIGSLSLYLQSEVVPVPQDWCCSFSWNLNLYIFPVLVHCPFIWNLNFDLFTRISALSFVLTSRNGRLSYIYSVLVKCTFPLSVNWVRTVSVAWDWCTVPRSAIWICNLCTVPLSAIWSWVCSSDLVYCYLQSESVSVPRIGSPSIYLQSKVMLVPQDCCIVSLPAIWICTSCTIPLHIYNRKLCLFPRLLHCPFISQSESVPVPWDW